MGKPLLSYYGGKQRMAAKILPLLPDHQVYVEPFCGGAAVFFAKGRPASSSRGDYREVLNDTNGQLVNFYRCWQDPANRQALMDRLVFTPYARAEHRQALEVYRDEAEPDPVRRAWATFITLNMSYSNKAGAGWKFDVRDRNSCASATWAARLARLSALFSRLDGVFIDECDALRCIEKWDSKGTLFYCDPPYPGADQGHYRGYTQADFKKLVDALKDAKGQAVLSCYDNEAVPDNWERYNFEVRMSAVNHRQYRGNHRRTEVVWVKRHTDTGGQLNLLRTESTE